MGAGGRKAFPACLFGLFGGDHMRSSVRLARLGGPLLVVLLAGPAWAGAPAKLDGKAIGSLLAEAVRLWQVPGLACAVVRGDQVHLAGAGGRRGGGEERGTADTGFAPRPRPHAVPPAGPGARGGLRVGPRGDPGR